MAILFFCLPVVHSARRNWHHELGVREHLNLKGLTNTSDNSTDRTDTAGASSVTGEVVQAHELASKIHTLETAYANMSSSDAHQNLTSDGRRSQQHGSMFSTGRRSESFEAGPVIVCLVLLVGVFIGCISACWGLQAAERADRKEASMLPSPLRKVLRSSVANVKRLTGFLPQSRLPAKSQPDVSNSESDDDSDDPILRRLIIMEDLYMMSEDLSRRFLMSAGPSPGLPVKLTNVISKLTAWESSSWALVEEEDGLYLCARCSGEETKQRLISWACNSASQLEVEVLPKVTLEGNVSSQRRSISQVDSNGSSSYGMTHVPSEWKEWHESMKTTKTTEPDTALHFRCEVSTKAIPVEQKKDPTTLYPFVVRREKGSKEPCLAIALGCDDEDSCAKWVKLLSMYSNIGKRYFTAFMWKLNADIAADLPTDSEKAQEILADIRNWRRRYCLLEHLHMQKSLCITYISEKADEGRVANILVSAEQGIMSSVRKMPAVPLLPLASWEQEHVRVNIHQYDIMVSGDGSVGSVQDIVLPTILHGFDVHQEQPSVYGGQEYSMYALEDADSCAKWISALQCASQELTRGTDVQPLTCR